METNEKSEIHLEKSTYDNIVLIFTEVCRFEPAFRNMALDEFFSALILDLTRDAETRQDSNVNYMKEKHPDIEDKRFLEVISLYDKHRDLINWIFEKNWKGGGYIEWRV